MTNSPDHNESRKTVVDIADRDDIFVDFEGSDFLFPRANTHTMLYANMLHRVFLEQGSRPPPTLDDINPELREKASHNWRLAEESINIGQNVFKNAALCIESNKDSIEHVNNVDFFKYEDILWGEIRNDMQDALRKGWREASDYNDIFAYTTYLSFDAAVRSAHIMSASLLPDRYASFRRLAPLLWSTARGSRGDAEIFVEGALRYLKSSDVPTRSGRNEVEGKPLPSWSGEKVGQAWFHQLVVLLLHLCQTGILELTADIVDLASCSSTAAVGNSVKNAKAARFLHLLREGRYPIFAHEAPNTVIIAKRLGWELAGWADANRQLTFMRNVERATAFCRNRLARTGEVPSANEVSKKSGLNWQDSSDLLNSDILFYEIDECHAFLARAHTLTENCPDCKELASNMDFSKYMKNGTRFPSSTD